MPLLAQPPTNPTAAGASRPLNTTHTVTASHYLLVSHRPPTLCSQLSPPASPATCCVARSARPAVCCGALHRSAWPSPAPPAVLVGVGRLLSTLSHARHSNTRTRQTTGRQRRQLTGCRVSHVARSLGSAGSLLRRTAPVGVAVSCSAGHAGWTWSMSVSSCRPCPAARQHRPRGQSGDAVAAKAAMGTGRRVVQLRLLGRQLSRAVHVRPSLVSWCDASFVRAYTLLPSWNGHAKRRGDGPRQARPERQRNAH